MMERAQIGRNGGNYFYSKNLEVFTLCQRRGSDLRPSPYEDAALPLSYAGNDFNRLVIVPEKSYPGNQKTIISSNKNYKELSW